MTHVLLSGLQAEYVVLDEVAVTATLTNPQTTTAPTSPINKSRRTRGQREELSESVTRTFLLIAASRTDSSVAPVGLIVPRPRYGICQDTSGSAAMRASIRRLGDASGSADGCENSERVRLPTFN